jgi:hypothetical protein
MDTREATVADTDGAAAPTEEELRIAAEMDRTPDEDPPGADAERKTLADLAAETPDEEPDEEQYTLFGTAPSVNSQVKGTKVSSSHVKFKAKQQQLPGQFQMGDVVELRVKVRVDKVEFSSKHDGDGNVVETKRVHQLTALSVEQVEVGEEFADVDGRERK